MMKRLLLPAAIAFGMACNTATDQGLGSSISPEKNDTSSEKQAPQDTAMATDTSLEGKWLLQPLLASDTASGKIPELNFSLADNRFTGNTGCNRMSGSFLRSANSLKFNEQLMTTKMACQGYNEKAFIDNLLLTSNFKIENGVLMLLNNKTVLSKWVRTLEVPTLKKA